MRRQLPTEMVHDGFSFRLLRRDGMLAIFEKWKPHYHAGFEVVVIQAPGQPFRKAGKIITPVHETFPSSSEWGKKGWSFQNLADATRKFEALAKRQKKTA